MLRVTSMCVDGKYLNVEYGILCHRTTAECILQTTTCFSGCKKNVKNLPHIVDCVTGMNSLNAQKNSLIQVNETKQIKLDRRRTFVLCLFKQR